MVLNNTNGIRPASGFTIVELLVVIVVIGILASITIVSYGGITGRANTTRAQTNGVQTQKVAEMYNAENSRYPASIAEFNSGTIAKLPTGITLVGGQTGTGTVPTGPINVTAANGATTVGYSCLVSCTNSAGGRITYWDFSTNAQSLNIIYVGAATATAASSYVAAS
ncbi:MAG: prepilin-type N-terminal cleavage/methylation domain-containing protein [Candidatus Saccharibacteria bacterium]